MKILFDTNIIIHREAETTINEDIGLLFNWIDNLHYKKCIHPLTIKELTSHKNAKKVKTLETKLKNYNLLKTEAPLHQNVLSLSNSVDTNQNDLNDTKLVNELYVGRVDIFITEDRKIHSKAYSLGIADKTFTIDAFLEKISSENPTLADYTILSVQKDYFGNISLDDTFFNSFKDDYIDFEKWFHHKSDEIAYICKSIQKILAFLYVKVEHEQESYHDITPVFSPKKRLKIGTFKVSLNGFKLGERFLKIIFDNAIRFDVEELYVTIFKKRIEQERLIYLLQDFGFEYHGTKTTTSGIEEVYIKNLRLFHPPENPKKNYPFFSRKTNKFIVPIYPEYHTNLLPDSILKTESPNDFKENEPFRNAISKVYISRSLERGLNSGDIIIFYRTGGRYKSVITTIGVVENVITDINNCDHFTTLCRQRSVFSNAELTKQWNYNPYSKPFIVNFLYLYSFPKRINCNRLIELGIIADINSVPRGFERISDEDFETILQETQTDESIIID